MDEFITIKNKLGRGDCRKCQFNGHKFERRQMFISATKMVNETDAILNRLDPFGPQRPLGEGPVRVKRPAVKTGLQGERA